MLNRWLVSRSATNIQQYVTWKQCSIPFYVFWGLQTWWIWGCHADGGKVPWHLMNRLKKMSLQFLLQLLLQFHRQGGWASWTYAYLHNTSIFHINYIFNMNCQQHLELSTNVDNQSDSPSHKPQARADDRTSHCASQDMQEIKCCTHCIFAYTLCNSAAKSSITLCDSSRLDRYI